MSYSPHEEEHLCEDGVRRKITILIDECSGQEDPLKEEDTWCQFVAVKDSQHRWGHEQMDSDAGLETVNGRIPYLDGDEELGWDDKKPICVVAVRRWGDNQLDPDEYPENGPGERSEWGHNQVGWIWMDAAGYKEWSGDEWCSNKKNRKRVAEVLQHVIKHYSHWCNGDVWGYQIEKLVACVESCTCGRDPSWEDDDEYSGCWGFVGDWDECGVLEEAQSAIGVKVEKKEKKTPPEPPKWRRQLHTIKKPVAKKR